MGVCVCGRSGIYVCIRRTKQGREREKQNEPALASEVDLEGGTTIAPPFAITAGVVADGRGGGKSPIQHISPCNTLYQNDT
jgi:hypothetical protein